MINLFFPVRRQRPLHENTQLKIGQLAGVCAARDLLQDQTIGSITWLDHWSICSAF